jgi:hypothetical protein
LLPPSVYVAIFRVDESSGTSKPGGKRPVSGGCTLRYEALSSMGLEER